MVKSKDKLDQILREYINLLVNRFNIFAVVLFGSCANGAQKKFSDIDLAVFSKSFGKDPISEMTLLCKLRRKVDTDIEALAFNEREFFNHSKKDFVNEILEKGTVIYKDGRIFI